MKKIKYENIITIMLILLFTRTLIEHIILNGWYTALSVEIILYIAIIFGIHYVIQDIRLNPKNWY